jgi:hypothetical protein
MIVSNDCDEGITLFFDDVTRKDMVMLRTFGVTNTPVEAPAPLPEEPPVKPKRTKAEQRNVRHEPPPGGMERRIQPRHELEAACTLTILDKGYVWKCSLLEISLSGCRLFSDTPFNISANTRVEVDFVGKGNPFRLAADVIVKDDEHLIGLHFVAMSSRCKDRLAELTSELAEKSAVSCF